ncbi:MAG: hypothetical protein Q8K36_03120, partial [Alphaproteobacteria bacterium]|nr:hypothetical protein [Alphaproteobacteria bacterium]
MNAAEVREGLHEGTHNHALSSAVVPAGNTGNYPFPCVARGVIVGMVTGGTIKILNHTGVFNMNNYVAILMSGAACLATLVFTSNQVEGCGIGSQFRESSSADTSRAVTPVDLPVSTPARGLASGVSDASPSERIRGKTTKEILKRITTLRKGLRSLIQ